MYQLYLQQRNVVGGGGGFRCGRILEDNPFRHYLHDMFIKRKESSVENPHNLNGVASSLVTKPSS